MQIASLKELLTHELRTLYDAELQVLAKFPAILAESTSSKLKSTLQEHLHQTQQTTIGLYQVFELRNVPPQPVLCSGMEAILAEGTHLLKRHRDGAVIDAGLIAVSQKLGHYRIARCNSALVLAEVLGDDPATILLRQAVTETLTLDARLSELARSEVNVKAADDRPTAQSKETQT